MICINKVSDSCELQIVVREFHFGLGWSRNNRLLV